MRSGRGFAANRVAPRLRRSAPARFGTRAGTACLGALLALAAHLVAALPCQAQADGESFFDAIFAQPKVQPAQKPKPVVLNCDKKHKAFVAAWGPYQAAARQYWSKVALKKQQRRAKIKRGAAPARIDYVLTHPPAYSGPKWPKCKKSAGKKPAKPAKAPKPRAVVADFLRSAKKLYGFVPKRVSEVAYKKAYAREALSIGLSANQVIGVYALETGGLGPFDRQSGIFLTDQNCRPIKAKGRAASSALGYAQLLAANSNAMVVMYSDDIADRLLRMADRAEPVRAQVLINKVVVLRNMLADITSSTAKFKRRNGWREYVAYGKTPGGMAVHALNLDADVGPLVQVHKLAQIRKAAARKGFSSPSGAQMELMNLVGFGRGLEMMQSVASGVPTANFFSRNGYERNPVAKDVTAGGLVAKLATIIKRKKRKCGSVEFTRIFEQARLERLAAAR